MEVIRLTKSVCPDCLKKINASVVCRGERIYLQKNCPEHGFFEITLSRDSERYRELEKFYFAVMGDKKNLCNYELWLTSRCNMNCNICVLGEEINSTLCPEPTCEEISKIVDKNRQSFWSLAAAEPTCREDIFEIISMLKKSGKTVTLNTNGIKLAENDFAKRLKYSGVDRVDLQFDGFEKNSYHLMRGCDLLSLKLGAIKNLRSMDIRTTLNATIALGVNEKQIMDLIKFGLKNDFINGITYLTIFYSGGARSWPKERYLMPDELVDLLQEQSNGKISKESVYLFQKLHIAVKSFLSQRQCLYNQIFLLVRNKFGYEPIDRFIDLKSAEKWLDRYASAFAKNRLQAGIYIMLAIAALLKNLKSLSIVWSLLSLTVSYLSHSGKYLKKSPFFALSFTTGCDPYKLDFDILRNCQNEIIGVNPKSGQLENLGSEGIYCLKQAGKTEPVESLNVNL